MKELMWAEIALVAVVFLILPGFFWCCGRKGPHQARGLGLPRGSVRSMLALLIVGSTVNFFVFGSAAAGEHFTEVMAALGTLSGSVIGFYFGGRTAAPHPPHPPPTESETQS